MFSTNQKGVYQSLEGGRTETIPPDPIQATEFWSGIWGNAVQHNENAEWIKNIDDKVQARKQVNIMIDENDVKEKVKTIPNWKAPGPDGIQGYWIKNLTSIHEKLARILNSCILNGNVPE